MFVLIMSPRTSVFIHRFNNLMSKAQMSDDFTGAHVRQLLTSFVFLQSIPTHLHRELMAFVSQQRRQADPAEADAAVNLLEDLAGTCPWMFFLTPFGRDCMGPDARISAPPGDPQAPSVKPIVKSPERPWSKKTPSPSTSTPSLSSPHVKFATCRWRRPNLPWWTTARPNVSPASVVKVRKTWNNR